HSSRRLVNISRVGSMALGLSKETYLAETQQLSHTGSFGWNTKTGEIFWSEQTFKIFGYDPALKPTIELVMQRVHPDDTSRVRALIDDTVKHQEDFEIGHRLLMPDGSVKHVQVVARVVGNKPGELTMMGAVMDITERKLVEEELARNEQRY